MASLPSNAPPIIDVREYTDFTAGAFQTCNGNDCITPTANWALDITTPDATSPTPEPGGLWVCGAGLMGVGERVLVVRIRHQPTYKLINLRRIHSLDLLKGLRCEQGQ